MKTRICLAGAAGSVGRQLVRAIIDADDLELSAAIGKRTAGQRLSLRHDSASHQPYVDGTLLAARTVNTFIGLKRGLANIMDLKHPNE